MNTRLSLAAASLLAMLATPALAQPPADAMPLSQIIAALEAQGDVAWIKEVDWDDDGYWEIEYRREGGGDVEIKIDPVSGEPRR